MRPTPTSARQAPFDQEQEPDLSDHKRGPRVRPEVEQAVIELALAHPGYGQDRVARELNGKGLEISASGVRYVWQRHDLQTAAKRVEAIELRIGPDPQQWSKEQLSVRDKTNASKRTRSIAASLVGHDSDGEVSRRLYILTVAAGILREKGYDATSLRDIAKAARIPLGSLYYHFQTREDLFAAVYREGIERLSAAVNAAIARVSGPWDKLEAACVIHLEQLCGGDDFTACSVPTNLPNLMGPTRETLIALNDRYEDIFRGLIAELELPKDASATLVRLQLLGALNWTPIWFNPGHGTAQEIGKHLVRMLRYGLNIPGR